MSARVLVVDDDLTIAEVVGDYLRDVGLETRHAADGPSALSLAQEWPPDLVVLDLMLPGIDGLEVCRRLRTTQGSQPPVPVIMLTALGEEANRVLGLETGADDYVTKPFSPRELTLRVQAVLRRASAEAPAPEPYRAGRFEVDVVARRIRRDGQDLTLTVREFDLLAFFLRHPGRAFSRPELLEQVWGWSYGDLSTVTVCVRRIREKTEDKPASPVHLQTVWGVGYRWDATPVTEQGTQERRGAAAPGLSGSSEEREAGAREGAALNAPRSEQGTQERRGAAAPGLSGSSEERGAGAREGAALNAPRSEQGTQ